MAEALESRHCVPCEGGTPPLDAQQIRPLLDQLDEGWAIEEAGDHEQLWHAFRTKDFVSAVGFVNAITPVAEEEGHHPDLMVGWGRVRVMLWTHAAGGLTENDFILAAKISRVARDLGLT
jgi:4a-hydroxytetrahydrobiopterin dehydratase